MIRHPIPPPGAEHRAPEARVRPPLPPERGDVPPRAAAAAHHVTSQQPNAGPAECRGDSGGHFSLVGSFPTKQRSSGFCYLLFSNEEKKI